MDDEEFIGQIKAKIERLTGADIVLHLDTEDQGRMNVELSGQSPEVTLGSGVLEYSGFARMAIEYAVASIRGNRELSSLEFRALLVRN